MGDRHLLAAQHLRDRVVKGWAAGVMTGVGATLLGFALAMSPAHASLPANCRITGAGAPRTCIVMPVSSVPRVGLQVQAGTGTGAATEFLIVDRSGAPMAWENLFGFYSGGLGGNPVGGLLCVTWGVAACVAALTPTGHLMLWETTPAGMTGAPEELTAADIAFLHKLEGITGAHPHLTVRQP